MCVVSAMCYIINRDCVKQYIYIYIYIIQPNLYALAARINSDSKTATSLTTRKLTIKTHNIIILYYITIYQCDNMSTVKAVGRHDRGPIGFDSGPGIIYAFQPSFFRRSYQFGYNIYIYIYRPSCEHVRWSPLSSWRIN